MRWLPRSMRAPCAASAVLAMIAGTVLLGAVSARAASATPCPWLGDRTARPDVDGDARPDVIVGIPTAVAGGMRSGAIDVHLAAGGVQRLGPSFFSGVPASAGEEFGAQLVTIDLELDDLCHDAAVGAPGSDAGRGSVVLVHGGESGFVAGGAVVLSGRSAGERFGAALAVGALTTEGIDLFVGAPRRTVSGHRGAGAVDHYVVPVDGGAPRYLGEVSQDTPGVPGISEAGDHFGATLAASWSELAVGVPDEAVGSRRAAGSVEVLKLDAQTGLVAARLLAQGYEGTPGVAEPGDRFGAALADVTGLLAVGSPGESVGRRRAVGSVYAYNRFSVERPYRMVRSITQDTPGVPGVNESGDQFGASLAAVEWCGMAIGSPGEDVGSAVDAGLVSVVNPVAPGASSCERAFRQGPGGGLGGALESGDRVGSVLSVLHSQDVAMLPFDQLLVGVPGEGVGAKAHAGVVTVLTPTWPGYTHRSYGDSAGPVSGERYGGAMISDDL